MTNTKSSFQLIFAAIIAVCALYSTFFSENLCINSSYIVYISLAFFLIVIGMLVWFFKSKRDKKVKYVYNFPKIIDAISDFINSYNSEKELIKYDLYVLLGKISDIYRDLKGVDVTLTVKLITIMDKDLSVRTFVRFPESDRPDREDFKTSKSYEKFIEENTDFKTIYASELNVKYAKELYFFCNDLVNYAVHNNEKYYHSRLNESGYYKNTDLHNRNGKNIMKEKLWCLPFKSTIVVPLGLMGKKPKNGDFAFWGTLCIDANKKNVFNEEIDVKILQSIAETIFLRMKANKKRDFSSSK